VSLNLIQQYSSVILNQNQVVAHPTDFASGVTGSYKQEFFLPSDYRRGTESGELRYPDLSGFQLLVNITTDNSLQASFAYSVEYQVFGLGWVEVTEGIAIGAPIDGTVWMTAYFSDPVEIDQVKAGARWRINFQGRSAVNQPKNVPVDYVDGVANVYGNRVVADLEPNIPWPFVFGGLPAFLYFDPANKQVYFSYQQGIDKFWFASPNPLALPNNVKGFDSLGPIVANGGEISFCFRVLSLAADSGVDFLGNQYRSVVTRNQAENISTALGADRDSYWLSKPNPSKFAVENLYFDVRNATSEQSVIDRLLIDPITPGAYFNVYYSVEGEAGASEVTWESKLWTRVSQTFRMERRETHVFPEPVTAKFIKIEFSHLQARHYAPGDFQQAIRYKKHPKWVLDYFLARLSTDQINPFLSDRVRVIYDALDLAYNYYLDDLGQEPSTTVDVNNTARTQVTSFLSNRTDLSDRIDPSTLDRINLVMNIFQQHPALRGTPDTLLAQYAHDTVSYTDDYPIEQNRPGALNLPDVSSLNRDSVVIEQDFPVMFFYLTCRHAYREVEAKFSHDRAYFVGVRELAFLRDNYMAAFDTGTYIEPAADTQNIERNEFI
jgi:hypothetical protein